MLISTPSFIKNSKLYLKKEVMNLLLMEESQKVYVYYDHEFQNIIISTIQLSDNLYFFRIPFLNDKGILDNVAAQFKYHEFNILKNDDVSFGRYAVLHIWAVLIGKFTKDSDHKKNFNSLIRSLNGLMPESLKEGELSYCSFGERKFTLFSNSDIIKTELNKVILENNLIEIEEIISNDPKIKKQVIFTCYDEYPLLLAQIISEDKIFVRITCRLKDEPGKLSSSLIYLSPYIDIKTSSGLVVSPNEHSIWIIYGTIDNYEEFDNIMKKAEKEKIIEKGYKIEKDW